MVDEADQLRLIDFGLARHFHPGQDTTTFLVGVGSQGYAPLEQYSGQTGTCPRSDLYGLGATLFHLLTSTAPPDPIQVMALEEERIPLREWNPLLPVWLEPVIGQLMALKREQRYQSAAEVEAVFGRLLRSLEQVERTTESLPVIPEPRPLGPRRLNCSSRHPLLCVIHQRG